MSSPERKKNSDAALEFTDIIGGHGPWQMVIFTFCFLSAAAFCFHNLIMTFFAPNIDHWCARPQAVLEANISVEEWKNATIPLIFNRVGLLERSRCTMYQNVLINNTILVPSRDNENTIFCESWEYDESFYKHTMVDDWNLVCDREWLVSLSKTVYMVGFLVSSTVCGQLSDKFGRRPLLIVCICIFLTAGLSTLLSNNFIVFIVLRFFLSIGNSSLFTISTVTLSEVVSVEYRSIYLFTFKYGWAFAYMLMPVVAWYVRSWFWLQCALTLPWLILLSVFWVIPETPKWLLTCGKFTQLEKLLIMAAKKNGKEMSQAKLSIHDFLNHHPKSEEKRSESVFALLKTPGLRRNTLCLYFCWFMISYIYYAIIWNTNDLGGDPYWTFFICGAVELPSGLIFMVICRVIGHRLGLLIANVFAGLCLVVATFIPVDMTWTSITFWMAGKFFASASFDIIYIYTAEIFPTVVRNVAVGSSSTFARIGALTAPFIRQLADSTHPSVPLAFPGCLCVISGLLLIFLPETKGRTLPDTLEEVEKFTRNDKMYEKEKKPCELISRIEMESL